MLKRAAGYLFTTLKRSCVASLSGERVGFRLPPRCWLVFVTYPRRRSLEVWVTGWFGFGRGSEAAVSGVAVSSKWWVRTPFTKRVQRSSSK